MGWQDDRDAGWSGWRLAARAAALAVGYAALLVVAYLAANSPGESGTLWWPPVGLATGALAVAPRRAWPALLVAIAGASLVLGLLGVPAGREVPVVIAVWWSVANMLIPLAAAAVYVRLARPPRDLRFVWNVVVLVAPAAIVAGLLNVVGSYIGLLIWPGAPPGYDPAVGFSSEALGVVTIAPLLLTLSPRRPLADGHGVEAVVLGAGLALTAWAAFALPLPGAQIVALASATFPLLAWAATRFGPRGAAWSSFLLTAFATWRTRLGQGPFGASGAPLERIAWVEVFFAFATITSLVLAAATAERRASEHATLRLQEEVARQGRRNEETLALLDAVLGSAPVGVAILDRDLRFLRVNPALSAMNGLPEQAHLGHTLRAVLREWSAPIERQMRTVLATGEPVIGFRLQGVDARRPGEPAVWECTWFPIRIGGHEPMGVCAIVVDVTDRVVAEGEREQALQQARDAIRLRDDFLQVASHELKTPLTPLSARLALLERRAAAGERLEPEAIARARASLRKLVVLVDELLDVTHLREVSRREGWTSCSLGDLVAEVAAPFRHRSSHHHLELDLPRVEVRSACDRANLARVLENLIDNAFKYSPGGGRIRVRLRVEGEDAVLSVSDEGIGIPRTEQATLFTRFSRATNAPARSYGGLGLGLYMSREIVERHGGRIEVASEEGRGATFTVRLPLHERAAATV